MTLEDDFAEDEVVVTIKNKESLKFKKYVASDFVDIGCESVDDLSIAYADDVRIHKDHACKKSAFAKDYNQLLSLKLKEKSKENVLAAIKVLEKRDDVLSAEPSYILDSFDSNVEENNGHGIEPNKAIGGGLPINPVLPVVKPTKLPNDPGRSRQWAIARIKLPEAWNYTTGSSDVVVGVIDSGVDSTHPDLQGKIDTSLSYDFVNNTSAMPATSSLFYHGTMVAGIIAAQTDNGEGIAGAGWNVRIASLRVGDSLGGIKTPYVVSAIEYARIKGIPVINLSLGGKQDDSRLRSAIEKYTGVIVCAAGNAEADNDDSKNAVYPASYSYRENLISVGASDTEDKRFINGGTGSNYGKTTVDLFAPGANIYSTMIQGRYQGSCSGTSYYESDSGTSYAAPYVSGVAALLLSRFPELTAAEIKDAIKNNVSKVSALSDLCVSGGRLNALNALIGLHSGHRYGQSYSFVSQTQHASFCECGDHKLEPHWAYSSSLRMYNGHRYATCACCKYEINIDNNPIIVISNSAPGELELMGLKVVESPKQLVQALSQNFRQTSSLKMEAVLSYYDEEFFETYAIVLSDDFDMERVVESLYSNIIECRKYIDKEGNFWYDTDNNYEEIYA